MPSGPPKQWNSTKPGFTGLRRTFGDSVSSGARRASGGDTKAIFPATSLLQSNGTMPTQACPVDEPFTPAGSAASRRSTTGRKSRPFAIFASRTSEACGPGRRGSWGSCGAHGEAPLLHPSVEALSQISITSEHCTLVFGGTLRTTSGGGWGPSSPIPISPMSRCPRATAAGGGKPWLLPDPSHKPVFRVAAPQPADSAGHLRGALTEVD